MNTVDDRFDWRIGYAAFCLVYAACIIYLGLDNFDKVHSEYRDAQKRLQPSQIEKIAHQELVDQCRKKLKRRGSYKADYKTSETKVDVCQSFPKKVLEEKKKGVKEQLLIERKRFLRKLVVFYSSFAIFFVALPLYLLYLLLSFLIWVFRDVKFIK